MKLPRLDLVQLREYALEQMGLPPDTDTIVTLPGHETLVTIGCDPGNGKVPSFEYRRRLAKAQRIDFKPFGYSQSDVVAPAAG
jgi:hypothetical protein